MIGRRHKAVAQTRIGMDLVGRDRTSWWEHLAFIALGFCGLFSAGYCLYCLKTLLSSPWPR